MSEEMRIIKKPETQSLFGRSMTYQVGCKTDNEVFVALTGNSGA